MNGSRWACMVFIVLAVYGFMLPDATSAGTDQATDLYFKTPGNVQGPAAPTAGEIHYPRFGSLDNRLLVWFVTQQHTYFGGFVLALPIFCVLLEFLGLTARNPVLAQRYDGLARDLLKVALLALSITAVVGTLDARSFYRLVSQFHALHGVTFKQFMPIYALIFVGENLMLILYYYSWDRMMKAGPQVGPCRRSESFATCSAPRSFFLPMPGRRS